MRATIIEQQTAAVADMEKEIRFITDHDEVDLVGIKSYNKHVVPSSIS